VLDFGLAKALDSAPDSDPAQSPTLTAAATQMGVILGTAAYMSPEQARERPVNRRADVWAFGAVLYEMLTGARACAGGDVSETLARVIEREPDWAALPSGTPPVLGAFLRRCLEKDPKTRVRDIGDLSLATTGAFEVSGAAGVAPAMAAGNGAARRRAAPHTVLLGG
jgi:serine/threonine-protein kinase